MSEVLRKLNQDYIEVKQAEVSISIRDLADKLKVCDGTLRSWEDKLEIKVPRNSKNSRKYPQNLVKFFEIIKQLLDNKHSMEEIKTIINRDYLSYIKGEFNLNEEQAESHADHQKDYVNNNYYQTHSNSASSGERPESAENALALFKQQMELTIQDKIELNNRNKELWEEVKKAQQEKIKLQEQHLIEKDKLLEDYYNKLEAEKHKVKEQVLEEAINIQSKANHEHRKEKEKILAEKAQEISELQAGLKKYKELQENKKEVKGFFNNIWKVLNTEVTRIKK